MRRESKKPLSYSKLAKALTLEDWQRKLADMLNVPCVVSELARVKIGHISISAGVPLQDVDPGKVISTDEALSFLPDIHVQGDVRKAPEAIGQSGLFYERK